MWRRSRSKTKPDRLVGDVVSFEGKNIKSEIRSSFTFVVYQDGSNGEEPGEKELSMRLSNYVFGDSNNTDEQNAIEADILSSFKEKNWVAMYGFLKMAVMVSVR